MEILAPRWTAALILVGPTVTFGVSQYQKFLEVQKSRLEIEKLRIEIEDKWPTTLSAKALYYEVPPTL